MRTIEIDNLILVEVPKDAKEFELIKVFDDYSLTYFINKELQSTKYLSKEEMEIIGLIETPNVDFDFEVEDSWVEFIKPFFYKRYKDYTDDTFVLDFTKKQSFRTRIQRKIQDAGLYLVNAHGENKPKFYENDKVNFTNIADIRQWQQAEEKTIKGNLLLIKKFKI